LRINAGHGLNYDNVKPIARLPYMVELNIGHSIISRSVFVGLRKAVEEMCDLIREV
ncbi:MAG: pyridoxine 5'-phosphate synthase, partial [Candidatus Omnitrophica bacterium]|nr:pyridoxine 5'-phosphate synthase [Candidatus Omnitrophota bacterium]